MKLYHLWIAVLLTLAFSLPAGSALGQGGDADIAMAKVKLTADEMQVIKASVEATSYAGQFSEMITKIKKKMTPPQQKAPVTDINQQAGGTD